VIMTNAIGKASFVIDAYARRLFSRVGVDVPRSYEHFRSLMQSAIPAETKTYALYHGLIVEHGQRYCNPRPKCIKCPISDICKRIGVN
jgi:endonuclease-3 related protein